MILPDYWLTRPSVTLDSTARLAFDALYQTARSSPNCLELEYTLPWPKWQFLCYLADQHGVALHGSGNADIALFEPRPADDVNEFGRQTAVYAAADGIWPMFFAVVERARVTSVANACIRLADEIGTVHGPFYLFSISQSALPTQPWRTGTVYLLPGSTFTAQPAMALGATQVQIAQLVSLVPVPPIAKLTVTPADFPFLAQIRGHDDERLQEYATAMQTGAPWPSHT